MKKIYIRNKGSALIFLIIIVSITLAFSSVVLTLAALNYKMKKINSNLERAFYLSEAGLEEAYILSRNFSRTAIEYSNFQVIESKEDIEIDNYDKLNRIFQSSFRNYITGESLDNMTTTGLADLLNNNNSYLINKDGHPIVFAEVIEKSDYFLVEIRSVCEYERVVRETALELKINVPFYCIEEDCCDYESYIIEIVNWKVEG